MRDEKGRPIRDHASTTYLASFESVEDFAPQLRREAIRRGVGQAGQVVFLSDGAAWTEELQRQNFPNAVSILDFYHAAERVHALARATVGAQDFEHPSTVQKRAPDIGFVAAQLIKSNDSGSNSESRIIGPP